jgi:hypothetical protein
MLDTIQLRHCRPLPKPQELQERGFTTVCGHTPLEGASKWINNSTALINRFPRLTWSQDRDNRGWLSAEVSLPKLLYGSNVKLLGEGDLLAGLETVSELIGDAAGVSFPALSARVGRVDYCHSWQVGEANVLGYIAASARASVSRLTRNVLAETTVNFRNKSRAIVIYSKYAETADLLRKEKATEQDLRESKGLLRLEVRHQTSNACSYLAGKLGKDYPTAENLLSASASRIVLENALEVVGLSKPVTTVDTRIELLAEQFAGKELLTRLVGFLTLRDHYGDERLLNLGLIARPTYFRYRRLLKDAGIALETPAQKSLPPLCLSSSPKSK